MKKNRVIEIILGILIILIILSLSLNYLRKDQPDYSPEMKEHQNRVQKATEETFSDEFTYNCLALVSDNISICSMLEDGTSCLNFFYLYKSINTEENHCDKISDHSNEICHAIKENSASKCTNNNDYCGAIITKDQVKCSSINQPIVQKECTQLIMYLDAVQSSNIDKCSELEFNNYVLCQGTLTKNAAICTLGRLAAEQIFTDEICNEKTDELTTAGKSFCKDFRIS